MFYVAIQSANDRMLDQEEQEEEPGSQKDSYQELNKEEKLLSAGFGLTRGPKPLFWAPSSVSQVKFFLLTNITWIVTFA